MSPSLPPSAAETATDPHLPLPSRPVAKQRFKFRCSFCRLQIVESSISRAVEKTSVEKTSTDGGTARGEERQEPNQRRTGPARLRCKSVKNLMNQKKEKIRFKLACNNFNLSFCLVTLEDHSFQLNTVSSTFDFYRQILINKTKSSKIIMYAIFGATLHLKM